MKTIENNKGADKFEEIIKRKLENYSSPIEESSWIGIEQRLNKTRKRKIGIGHCFGISVAASIAIVFALFHENPIKQVLPSNGQTITENVPTEKALPFNPAPDKQTQQILIWEKRCSGTSQLSDFPESHVNPSCKACTKEEELAKTDNVNSKKSDTQNHNFLANNSIEEIDFKKNNKKKKRTSLGFQLGSDRRYSSNTNYYSLYLENREQLMNRIRKDCPFSNEYKDRNMRLSISKDFDQIIHSPPISIGFNIRKGLTNHLSIESGLNYTYFHSTLTSKNKANAQLELHYLGIPVNFVLNLFPPPRNQWRDIYISFGGTIEKGLLSHYKQTTYKNHRENNLVVNEKIKGLQWSLQTNFGVAYQFHEQYSLFLEPKITCYLGNNQPFDLRTEPFLVFGANAGIRYSW